MKNLSKKQLIFIAAGVILVILIIVLIVGVTGSDEDSDKTARQRRSDTTSTTQSSTTSTTSPAESTLPIDVVPFIEPAQLRSTWPQEKLCALITPEQARDILGMSTTPRGEYFFNESIGARCTYSSGAGDDLYFEISSTSFKQSRSIDEALNAPGKPIVVSGVGAVVKVNKAIGTTYELNISGQDANQWVASAPTDDAALELAKLLIAAVL